MKQGNWHDIGLFTSTLSSNVSKQHNVKAYLSLTTEQNSYGTVSMQWLDGKVETFQLHRGSYQLIQINQIKRFEYLPDSCSDWSVYECWGSKLSQQCQSECTPFTLPNKLTSKDFPICSQNEMACTENKSSTFDACA